jgi:hypothetical protein
VIYKTLLAVCLTSITLTSYASAQCVDCSLYPNRDPLNGGAETPAGKIEREGSNGRAASNNGAAPRNANNASAQMRSHDLRSGNGSGSKPPNQ